MAKRRKITEDEKNLQKTTLLMIMTYHVGASRKIGMGELYEHVFGAVWENRINDTRKLRTMITELRNEGIGICSDGNGYYLASSSSELEDYLSRDKKAAMKKLEKIARMERKTMPELLGQIQLTFEDIR